MNNKSPETKLLHTDYDKPDAYGSLSMPVYHTAAYEFKTAEEMSDAFLGLSAEHTYSRITNPTVQYFEKLVRTMTGAAGVTALSSGMAAIANAIICIAKAGANIVTSPHLFGNTYSFFATTMAAFGVEARFCDLTNLEEVEQNTDEKTCCLFLEVITNPQLEIADLKALSEIAKRKGFPLIADTTVVSPQTFNAKDWGVNIEIISSTKYISGGATSVGGLIIDYANFDWNKSEKLKEMAKGFGPMSFSVKMRKEIHRNLGAYMTPHAAYMQTLGLSTLALRYEKATDNCRTMALRLSKNPNIESVNYTALPGNKFYDISTKQFGERPGAVFTFNLASKDKAFKAINKLQVIKRATNLFDNKSLAIHPASTIFGTFSEDIRRKMNVSDKTVRVSVGIESVEDLIADIEQAVK